MTYNLIPAPTERVLTIGSTGSGKTSLNRVILQRISRHYPVAILDTKGDDALLLDDSFLITQVRDIKQWTPRECHVLVYRPVAAELNNPATLDMFLQMCYDTGGIYTYVDELSQLQQQYRPGIGLTNLLARGRLRYVAGRKVSSPLGMSTQRPRRIPVQCYTEASRIYCFALNNRQDRAIVTEFADESFLEQPRYRYGFRVYDVASRTSYHLKALNLRERR